MTYRPPQRVRVIRIVNPAGDVPSPFAEYTYYASLFYETLGAALGLEIPLLNIIVLMLLAIYGALHLGQRRRTVFAPIVFPLACGMSYIAVQLVFYSEPPMGGATRTFLPWMLSLMVIQVLSLRQGFLHRFAFAALVLGVAPLPFLQFAGSSGSDLVRLRLENVSGLSNANNLGAWFGFSCVYCTIAGLENKRGVVRMASWLAAVGCLYVVGLTVSRGALLASAVSIIMALRRLMRRGFVPVLLLVVLSWTVYTLGVFEQTAHFYAERGMEETGRLVVWPLAIERFLNSPFIGVGNSSLATLTPTGKWVTPHNSFIFIAVGAGIVPLVFFLRWWIRAIRGVGSIRAGQRPDAPFQTPLLVYAFLSSMDSNVSFMSPWVTVSLSMATSLPHRLRWVKRPALLR